MASDFDKMASDFLNSPQGARFKDSSKDIEKLLDSDDGKEVKKIIEQKSDVIKEAASKGDIDVLKRELASLLTHQRGRQACQTTLPDVWRQKITGLRAFFGEVFTNGGI